MCDGIINNPADNEIVYAESKRQAAREAIENENWSEAETLYAIVLRAKPEDLEANLFYLFAKLNRKLFEQGNVENELEELKQYVSDFSNRRCQEIDSEFRNYISCKRLGLKIGLKFPSIEPVIEEFKLIANLADTIRDLINNLNPHNNMYQLVSLNEQNGKDLSNLDSTKQYLADTAEFLENVALDMPHAFLDGCLDYGLPEGWHR